METFHLLAFQFPHTRSHFSSRLFSREFQFRSENNNSNNHFGFRYLYMVYSSFSCYIWHLFNISAYSHCCSIPFNERKSMKISFFHFAVSFVDGSVIHTIESAEDRIIALVSISRSLHCTLAIDGFRYIFCNVNRKLFLFAGADGSSYKFWI